MHPVQTLQRLFMLPLLTSAGFILSGLGAVYTVLHNYRGLDGFVGVVVTIIGISMAFRYSDR